MQQTINLNRPSTMNQQTTVKTNLVAQEYSEEIPSIGTAPLKELMLSFIKAGAFVKVCGDVYIIL